MRRLHHLGCVGGMGLLQSLLHLCTASSQPSVHGELTKLPAPNLLLYLMERSAESLSVHRLTASPKQIHSLGLAGLLALPMTATEMVGVQHHDLKGLSTLRLLAFGAGPSLVEGLPCAV